MKNYWQGDESLAKTFWLVWVAGALFLSLAGAAVTIPISLAFGLSPYSLALLVFLILLFHNPYYIFCWVANWRSTKNTSLKSTAIGVKILVLAHIAYVTYNLFSMGNYLKNGI
tara:strand:- start:106 stop:444 length:339 start_codon:yes stop_codon:yes gene_type:complete